MSIRQVVLATIVAAGFSFTASAAPVVKQAPIIPGTQLTLAHNHNHHHPAAAAGHHHRHHHHGITRLRGALPLVLVIR